MATKVCSKCGVEKDVGEFSKDTRARDGMVRHCKACQRRVYLERTKHKAGERAQAAREQDERKRLFGLGLKKCPSCGQVKSTHEFGPKPRAVDGLNSWCRVCATIATKKSKRKNHDTYIAGCRSYRERKANVILTKMRTMRANKPEVFREYLRRWREANPDRNRELELRQHARQKKIRDGLHPSYIKRLLQDPNAPPELIEMKREQLATYRLIKEFTQVLKEVTQEEKDEG